MIRPFQGPSKYKAGLGPYTTPAKPHVPKRIRTCGPGPAPPRPPPAQSLSWFGSLFSSTNSQSPPQGLSIKWPRQVLMYPVPFGLGDKQQKHPWCPKPILFIPSFPAQTANRPRRALPSNGPGWFYFTILHCPSLLKLLADLVLIEESATCRLQLPAIALLPP